MFDRPHEEVSTWIPAGLEDDITISESLQRPPKTEAMQRRLLMIKPDYLYQMSTGMQDPMLKLLQEKMGSDTLESTVGQELLSFLTTYMGFEPAKSLRFSSLHDTRIPPEAHCADKLQTLSSQSRVVDPASLQQCLQEKGICPALPCLIDPPCTVVVVNDGLDLQQKRTTDPFQHTIDSLGQRGHVFPLLLASCLSGSTLPAQENAVTYFEVPEPSALSTDLNKFKVKICTVGNPTVSEELRALLQAGQPITVKKGVAFTVAEQLVALANYVLLAKLPNDKAEGPSGSLTDSEDSSQDFNIIGGTLKEPAPAKPKAFETHEDKYFRFSPDDGGVQLMLTPETQDLLARALEKGRVKLPEPRLNPPEGPAYLHTCVVAAVVPRSEQESTKNMVAPNQPMTTTISISCTHCQPARGLSEKKSMCDACLQKEAVPGCAHVPVGEGKAPGSRAPSLCDKCLQKMVAKLPSVCQHSKSALQVPRSVSVPTCRKCKKTVTISFSGSLCRGCKHGSAETSLCRACTQALATAAVPKAGGSVSVSLCTNCEEGLARAAQSVSGSGSLCRACTQALATVAVPKAGGSVSVSLCTNCEEGLARAAQSVSGSGSLCRACTKAMATVTVPKAGGSVSVSLCTNCEEGLARAAQSVSGSGSLCRACTQALATATVAVPKEGGSVSLSLCTNCEKNPTAQSVLKSGSLRQARTKAMATATVAVPKAGGSVSVSLCTNCEEGLARAAQSVSGSGSLCRACTQALATATVAVPKEGGSVSLSLCTNCEKNQTAQSVPGSARDAYKDCVSVSLSCDVCSGREAAANNETAINSRTDATDKVKTSSALLPFCDPSFSLYQPEEASGLRTQVKTTMPCFESFESFESFEVPYNSGEPQISPEDIFGTCFDSFSLDNPQTTSGQQQQTTSGQQQQTSGSNLVCTDSFSLFEDDVQKQAGEIKSPAITVFSTPLF